jgi:hypothetical protein
VWKLGGATKIAEFSDTIFDANWAFPSTVSRNEVQTEHDGVFLLMKKHVGAYVERFAPQCLRSMAGSGKEFDLDFMNFKVAKGSTFDRVLIVPTAGITAFAPGIHSRASPCNEFFTWPLLERRKAWPSSWTMRARQHCRIGLHSGGLKLQCGSK